MRKKNSTKPSAGSSSVETSLVGLAEKLDKSPSAKRGDIVFRLSGATSPSGEFYVTSGPGKSTVTKTRQGFVERKPLIEVWGDADVIRAILDGEKDAVKQFMTGGLRIRGDLRYFSDLGTELGILKKPL